MNLCGNTDNDTGTEGQVGHHDDATDGDVCRCRHGERTGGRTLDWHAINWRAVEEDVRRLRQRIFTASQVGDLKRVRSLQKLMLRSRANTLLSVRRVTEVNAGRKTAGVDGKVVLLSSVKADLADWVQRNAKPWQARPRVAPCQLGSAVTPCTGPVPRVA